MVIGNVGKDTAVGEKRKGTKEARKPKKVAEKTIAAAPSLKGGTAGNGSAKK